MKKLFVLFACFVFAVALSNCGGSSSDDGSGGATPTATDAQVSTNATRALVNTMQSTTGYGRDISANAAALIKEALKNKVAPRTNIEWDYSETYDCTDGGSETWSLVGSETFDDEGESGTIDIDLTDSYDQCLETYEYYTADDALCSSTSMIDGGYTCTMSGEYTMDDLSFTFSCDTADTCDGLTLTFEGVDYTVGFSNFGAVMTSVYDDPIFTGTICVDGTEYSIEEIDAQMDEYEYDELDCE